MDAVSGRPYICIGGVDAKVKIYDVISGELVEVCIITTRRSKIEQWAKEFLSSSSALSAMEGFVFSRHFTLASTSRYSLEAKGRQRSSHIPYQPTHHRFSFRRHKCADMERGRKTQAPALFMYSRRRGPFVESAQCRKASPPFLPSRHVC